MITKTKLVAWLNEQGLTGLARDVESGRSSLLKDVNEQDHPLFHSLMMLERLEDVIEELKEHITGALQDL
jgi:hypothetical protein